MKRIRSSASVVLCSIFFGIVMMALPATSGAQIGIGLSVNFGPPALPVYEQPPCPSPGYLWTPGYWAYGPDGYYWVPGTWVMAPQPGFLWTPGWWGWGGSAFIFHVGYWGPHIGFYGGINYGFGYFGHGYEGGEWRGGQFFYNRSVNNVNVTNIHNVYNTTVINNTTVNRVSYNGGNGGLEARPTSEEQAVEHEQHIPPVAAQTRHEEAARNDPQQRASVNRAGRRWQPRAGLGELKGAGVVPAREAGAPYHPPAGERGNAQAGRPENNVPRPPSAGERGNEQAGRPGNNVPRPPVPNDAKDLQATRTSCCAKHREPLKQTRNTSNSRRSYTPKQQQDHQKLAQKQEQEHQRLAKQNASDAQKQQTEQRHQQQTAQLEQKHTQQQQKMQSEQGGGAPKERK